MKLLVALEAHFYKTPDGRVWTKSTNGYRFWKRYLEVFDEIIVVARLKKEDKNDKNWTVSSGKHVTFADFPDYIGPWEYMRLLPELKKVMRRELNQCDCAVLRIPGAIGTIAWREIRKTDKPYVLEVCGDPWESLAPGSVRSIARPIARIMGAINLKRQCKSAIGTAYVTEHALQRRYPPKSNSYTTNLSDVFEQDVLTTHYSSIEIDNNMFYQNLRVPSGGQIRIINVGSMETLYKGQEIQIKAIKECVKRGYNIRLDFIGDGRCRPYFEKIVMQENLKEYIGFFGMLPGPEAVIKELDKSHLFILPSFVEGLPRALIEAMARSLPCIATNVGGIPELLPDEDLVPPNDYLALSNKIIEVISNKDKMKEMSERNYQKSKEYSPEILNERRKKFYTFLKQKVK